MKKMKPVIIGIMGGSAAGKTTLARQLADSLADFSPVILNQDHYFRDFSEYEPDERERIITSNHPSAILWSSLIEHLSLLSNRQPIQVPVSGSRSLSSKQKLTIISPSDLVILEGHLIFWHQQIRDLLQIKIYLDVDPHERVLRRLLRSADTPNFDLKWQIDWYRRDVTPNYSVYTEPCKKYADLILPFEENNGVGVEIIMDGLRKRLASLSTDTTVKM